MSQNTDLEALLNELKENPDKIYNTDITEEQLLNITKKISPYSYVRPIDNSEEDYLNIAAISHTNLEEDYIRRFLMTSMVGFIYRMYDEYNINPEERSFIDVSKKVEKINDKSIYTPFSQESIKGNVRQLNKYIKEMDIVHERLDKLKYLRTNLELEDKPIPKETQQSILVYEKSVLSLTYICTHLFKEFGADAERRTEELVEQIKEYKDVFESIQELGYKPPIPPEYVVASEPFCKKHVKDFIDSYFEYNPDQHVRCTFDKKKLTPDEQNLYDKFDKYRPTMELLKTRVGLSEADNDLNEIFEDRSTYNACMHLLKEKPHLLEKLSKDPQKYKTRLMPIIAEKHLPHKLPPDDTFHRWGYYTDVNMEEIRNTVSAIYNEKPVFDLAIQIYQTFDGTKTEVDAAKKKWISKYNEELCSDVNMVPVGNWVLLANYKKNREEIDFYNRQTEVLRRIMDKHEDDKKLGKDLMMKRVKKAKSKNIKEAGKDADIMKQYQGQFQNLTSLGAKRALTMEEQKEIENVQKNIKDLHEVIDVPDNAIQVNSFEHNAKTGEFTKSALYTESAAPLTTTEIEEHMEAYRKGDDLKDKDKKDDTPKDNIKS